MSFSAKKHPLPASTSCKVAMALLEALNGPGLLYNVYVYSTYTACILRVTWLHGVT